MASVAYRATLISLIPRDMKGPLAPEHLDEKAIVSAYAWEEDETMEEAFEEAEAKKRRREALFQPGALIRSDNESSPRFIYIISFEGPCCRGVSVPWQSLDLATSEDAKKLLQRGGNEGDGST